MKRNVRKDRMLRKGFTLVELLIVLAILVMLAAFAVPKLFDVLKNAKVNTAKTQVKTFTDTLDLYATNSGGDYPTTEDGLNALVQQPEDFPETGTWSQLMPSIPVDPWNSPYQYALDESTGSPHVWSYGPDKQDGTEDDIKSWKDEEEGGDNVSDGATTEPANAASQNKSNTDVSGGKAGSSSTPPAVTN
ncbi:MAG: type II secretion system major pseudopilin GspG [Thermoguttaceae bacterium]|nr:type II secretion system major pseudopilin GspG [Thermoguttaceae bacterium]